MKKNFFASIQFYFAVYVVLYCHCQISDGNVSGKKFEKHLNFIAIAILLFLTILCKWMSKNRFSLILGKQMVDFLPDSRKHIHVKKWHLEKTLKNN